MRDLVIREALTTMAGDAALRLRELLGAGKEIPYEVRESGDGSPLAEYVPQTARFIREHTAELARLDSFGAACAALDSRELAGAYLQEMGVPEPHDARKRAELAGVVFLCRLWQTSTDFTLDDRRLAQTADEVMALGDAPEGEIEIAVPLRGFQMDVERLDLADVTIVRADTVDVPNEARAQEGAGGAGWQAVFLAAARLGTDERASEVGTRAVATFRRLVSTLRLFKAGGVALGPHAWIRTGGERWRRIATGAGRPRPGGYRLADTELAELACLARALAEPQVPFARGHADDEVTGFPAVLARAVSRFEAGLERPYVLEALNDYLLAMRFVLEGGGPAGLGLSMRIAALCAEPDARSEVKRTVELALALERELWSGEPAPRGDARTPARITAELEELVRAILKDAACGHLGHDLRATADEILLGDGLAVGEGSAAQRGETAEWDPASEEETPLEGDVEVVLSESEVGEELDAEPEFRVVRAQNMLHEVDVEDHEMEVEEPEMDIHQPRMEFEERAFEWEDEIEERPPADVTPLHAVPAQSPVASLIAASDEHRREVANRVSYLFPQPDTCEWKVPEVGYDRRRRAQVDDHAHHN